MKVRTRAGAITLAVLGLGALAVGCSTAAGTPTAQGSGAAGAFAAYAQCLQRNGVTLPSRSPGAFASRSPGASPRPRPSGSGGFGGGGFGGGGFGFGNQPPAGVDQATWDRAQQACASVRPTGGPSGRPGNSAFAAYRNCLSDHGVSIQPGQGMNTADPKTAAALRVCAPLRPTARPSAAATG